MTTISAGAVLSAVQNILNKDGSGDRRVGQQLRAERFETQMKLEEEANAWNRQKAEHENAVHTVEGLTSVVPVVGNAIGTFLTMEDSEQSAMFQHMGVLGLLLQQPSAKAGIEGAVEGVTGLPVSDADRGKLADATGAAADAKTDSERAKKAFDDLDDLRQRGAQNLSQSGDQFGNTLRDLADTVRQINGSR